MLALSILAAAGPLAAGQQQPAEQAQGSRTSARKMALGGPESISGTISLVEPQEGLLVVTKSGPGQPSTLVISSTTMVTHNPDGSTTRTSMGVSPSEGPGETDYSFRVTGATAIRVNGKSAAPADLATLRDRKATVRFVPQRNGNLATAVDVGP